MVLFAGEGVPSSPRRYPPRSGAWDDAGERAYSGLPPGAGLSGDITCTAPTQGRGRSAEDAGGVGEKGMVYEMMPAKSKIGAGAGSAKTLPRRKIHAADSRLSVTISRTSTAILTSRSQVLRAARRAGMSLAVTSRTSVSSPASLTRTDDLSPTSPASWQTEW